MEKNLLTDFNLNKKEKEIFVSFLSDRETLLDDDQREALCEILTRFFNEDYKKIRIAQLLPADTGWGKTRVAIYAALFMHLSFGMETIIICPANIRNQWIENMEMFKLKPLEVYSYEEIRGIKSKKKFKHPYLKYCDRNSDSFAITTEWEKLLDRGIFLVIDESQKLKNDSLQHFACVELVYSLCNRKPYKSRLLYLTASFIDKPDNWANLMRCFGYTKQKEMLFIDPFTLTVKTSGYGIEEVKAAAEILDKEETDFIFSTNLIRKPEIIFNQLWAKIFKKHLVIPVIDPIYKHPITNIPFKRLRYNAFYELDEKGKKTAGAAIAELKKAHIIDDEGTVNLHKVNNNFSLIQKALMKLCKAKINTIVRLAIEDLESYKTRKVILAIPFIKEQEEAFKLLEKYNPLVLNGDVKFNDRTEVISKFNEPTTEFRLLIMTPEVGGVGVSLHDTHGNFPRRMRMVSTYNFGSCFQTTGRTYRRGLMSDVEVFIIYAANAPLESILINTLVKSKVCNDTIIPGSNRVFPGEYEIYIENEERYPDIKKELKKYRKLAS